MRVLVSAYACEPGKGSEPGVGWRWSIEIAQLGHETHVITRANNEPSISEERARGNLPDTLHFHYYDLKPWQRFWKRGGQGVYLYNLLWQLGAAQLGRQLHKTHKFDVVHHLTFGSVRLPSFMGALKIPFIFGPSGGGESAPLALRAGYPLKGKIKDALRDVSNYAIRIDPLMTRTFRDADRILLKTKDSISAVPKRFRDKCEVKLEIGIDAPPEPSTSFSRTEHLRVLFAGRFIYWKGMHLGLRAFALLQKSQPNSTLTIVGDGPDAQNWQQLIRDLQIEEQVEWIRWVPRDAMNGLYASHDVFLFPSLHDSSGNVVLEAASHALPVVCLDLGGPSTMVTNDWGCKIDVDNASECEVVDRLARALLSYATNRALLDHASVNARNWAATRSWAAAAGQIYGQTGPA